MIGRPEEKIAFVVSNGGLASSISAGALAELVESGIRPGILAGASGSVGGLSLLTAGQPELISQVWTRDLSAEVSGSSIVNGRRFEIDTLIDTVIQPLLDLQRLTRSQIQLAIAATHAESGQAHFFQPGQFAENPTGWLEALRASKAIPNPAVFGKEIEIPGFDGRFVDGAAGASMQDLIDHAALLGATRILALDTRQQGTDLLFLLGSRGKTESYKKAIRRVAAAEKNPLQAPAGTELLHFDFDRRQHGLNQNSAAELAASFEFGREFTRARMGQVFGLLRQDSLLAAE